MKKYLLIVMGVVLAISPFMPRVHADADGWEPIMASESHLDGTVLVKQLALPADAVGPIQLGKSVFIGVPVSSCAPRFCDRYDLYLLRDGAKKLVGNVPAMVLDQNRFARNQNRLVYANAAAADGTRWSVVEVDLETGDKTTLAENIFINNPSAVDVYADGTQLFFEVEYNFNGSNGYRQAAVLTWKPIEDRALPIAEHWELNREKIEDVKDGVALVKMTFPSGHKQLWLMDSATVNYHRGNMQPIPNTWTEAHEDIVAAHFTPSGMVEFFRNFTRTTYNPATPDVAPVVHGEKLNWFRPAEDAYRIADGEMLWLTPDGTLLTSDGVAVEDLGAVRPSLSLPEDGVIVAKEFGKHIDPLLIAALGFHNGTDLAVSDPRHFYYRWNDAINEVSAAPAVAKPSARAVRVAGDNTVYLVKDNARYAFPDEAVYFSWFPSWKSVRAISQAELWDLEDNGPATFAPGSRVKAIDSPRVYVVSKDATIHWIMSEYVAYALYGIDWNKGIVEAPPADFFNYRVGDPIQTERDLTNI